MVVNFDNETNASTLQATRDLQSKSLEALRRIQSQAAETHAVGAATLTQLHEHDGRIDNVQQKTNHLNDALKKTDKLQNKFAFLSMNFGNKKTAKQHVKADKKIRSLLEEERNDEEKADQPTFKRRGPRPKKAKQSGTDVEVETSPPTSPSSTEEALRQSMKASQEMNVEVERNELFYGRKVDLTEKKKKPSSKASKSSTSRGGYGGNGSHGSSPKREEQQLTNDDRRQLDAIKADDAAVDAGIDILGNQVASLLQLSKQIGETTASQNTKLDALQSDLSKVNDKTSTANQRAKLFTMNRSQKRKENDNRLLGLGGNPLTGGGAFSAFAVAAQTFK